MIAEVVNVADFPLAIRRAPSERGIQDGRREGQQHFLGSEATHLTRELRR
jgi:hypothetical protein